MRLALLVGANPKYKHHGPRVRLAPGTWRIECEGVKDSSIFLTFGSDLEDLGSRMSLQNEASFEIEEHTIAQVMFSEWGTESYITVMAEKIA